ncbi:MAG: tetratricopeptide repeat protein [Cyclobacteriaceae bacterium]|nr:tetratricopeptide repeat protein [Cyclobacteriaceae bacterium]
MDKFQELIKEGEYEEAVAGLKQILQNDQYNTEAMVWLAKALFKLEVYDEAITNYNTLINLLPAEADLYSDRGLCYHMAGDHKTALEDFDKAVSLEPENAYRYSCRAFVKGYYKDYQGALEDYNKAIELDPEDAIAYNNKGILEEQMGYAEEAKRSYDRSNEIQGIDLDKELAKINTAEALEITLPQSKEKKLTFKSYLTTLKYIFTKEGFKDFFKFLTFKK